MIGPMRLVPLAGVLALIAGALFYLTVLRYRDTTFEALVPADARFVVVYGSANGLRRFYEGPVERSDFDPAVRRIGERANVPGLDGIDYTAPVGSYWTPDREEVQLVPYVDFGAFVDAWEVAREDTNLQKPARVAKNYLSVSRSPLRARIGEPNPLARRALAWPVAVAGRTEDAFTVAGMLYSLFGFESRQQPEGLEAYLLHRQLMRLPPRVVDATVEACDDLLIGMSKPPGSDATLAIDVEATPAAGGPLEGARAAGGAVDLGRLAGTLPLRTTLFLGATLGGEGWKALGMPLPCGDAAVVFAIVQPTQRHPRPFNLLVAVQPAAPDALLRLDADGPPLLAGDVGLPAKTRALQDGGTTVLTAQLPGVPAWLATVLRCDSRDAPPVFLTTASEGGCWYAAVGAQAERVVRDALACLRGAEQLSVRAKFNDVGSGGNVGRPLVPLRAVFEPHGFTVGMLTVEGLQALAWPMPYLEIGSVGQPGNVCWRGDPDDAGRLATRIELRP